MMVGGLTVCPAIAGIQWPSCNMQLTFRNLPGFWLKAGMTIQN